MAVYTVEWNPFHPRVFISCRYLIVSRELVFHSVKLHYSITSAIN